MHPRDKLNLIEASRKATITGGKQLMDKSIDEMCKAQYAATNQYMFTYKQRLYRPTFTLPVGNSAFRTEELIEELHANMDIYLTRKEFIDHNLPMLDTYFRRIIQRCKSFEEYLHSIPVALAQAILREITLTNSSNFNADSLTNEARITPECFDEDLDNLIYDCLSLKLLWG